MKKCRCGDENPPCNDSGVPLWTPFVAGGSCLLIGALGSKVTDKIKRRSRGNSQHTFYLANEAGNPQRLLHNGVVEQEREKVPIFKTRDGGGSSAYGE